MINWRSVSLPLQADTPTIWFSPDKPFCIDQLNQPQNRGFLIGNEKFGILGLIELINAKRVYQAYNGKKQFVAKWIWREKISLQKNLNCIEEAVVWGFSELDGFGDLSGCGGCGGLGGLGGLNDWRWRRLYAEFDVDENFWCYVGSG